MILGTQVMSAYPWILRWAWELEMTRFWKQAQGWALAVGCVTLGSGCASGDEQLRADLVALEQRITDLERTSGRMGGSISSVQEDILLLEDRVEAQRLSLERRGMVRTRSREELPRYETPSPVAFSTPTDRPTPAPGAPELPVERLAPRGRAADVPPPSQGIPELPVVQAAPDADDGPVEELVITNDTIDQFVAQHGGVSPTSDDGFRTSAATGAPLEPVVRNDRLPVNAGAGAGGSQSGDDGSISLYQESLALFNDGDYRGARAGFQRFLDGDSPEDYRDNALYWIGECHFAEGSYTAALAAFERVVREFPDGNKVPDSLLKIGLTHERLNDQRSASEVLRMLVETYPTTEAARRASERLLALN
jgi:tol-pal system protein YbgF